MVGPMLVLSPNGYGRLLRPLLFKLAPERAQQAAELALRASSLWRALAPVMRVACDRLTMDLCGVSLDNPIGLAAGYDKDCRFLPSLAALGFGYLVGGTVTATPRPGNPRPRLLRRVSQEALVNSLGFPGKGVEHAAEALALAREAGVAAPVMVSVAGTTAEEVLQCHARLEPLVEVVEVNISSPNTAGLRVFHEPRVFADLVGRLNHQRRKPLLVKLPPYLATPQPDLPAVAPGGPGDPSEDASRHAVFDLLKVCLDLGVDGVTVSNSRPVLEPRLATGHGGLSGRPLFQDTLRMVAEIRAGVGDRLAINACGGISSGEEAWRALNEGATTVQIYAALVYGGPGIVRRMNRDLLAAMDRDGVPCLRGRDLVPPQP